MNFISGNKLMHHLDRLGSNKPITAEIFLTDLCNHNCDYCDRLNGTNSFLSFKEFKSVVRRLLELGVKGFILTGGGEPFLNPELPEIIEWLGKMNLKYGVNTNGSVFFIPDAVFLKVSIDGYDAEDYARKRGVTEQEYFNVINNVKNWAEYRRQDNMTLGVQSVVIEPSDEIEKFYRSVKDLDVNYIAFRPLEEVGGSYCEDEVREIVERIDRLARVDDRVLLNYKWNLDLIDKRFKRCLANWSVITVDVSGRVLFCCQRKDVVGHIFDENILDKKMAYSFKADMSLCEVPCRLSGSNEFLSLMGEGGHCEFI